MRLCECFSRWQRSSPDTTGPRDEVLKDHFVKGLREGPLKIELERHGRRNPTVTFGALCVEAEAVEKETTRRETLACRAYVAPTTTASHQGPIPPSEWDRLKEALHAELKQEIQSQVSLLGKTIVEEIHSQLQQEPALAPRSNYQPTREDNRRDERPNHSSGMTKGAPYVLSVESLATFNVTAHDVPTGRVFLLLGHCRAGDRRG